MSVPDKVTAELFYFIPPADGSRAFSYINADPETGERKSNHESEPHNFFRRASAHKAFTDDAAIAAEYYPESIELVKELTGATRVVPFDHTIRRRRPDEVDDSPDKRQPVPQVHVDQTNASAIARVHRHLPPTDAPALLRRRFQIINLWRPISHAAYDWPLALCDYRSVDPKADLVPVALIYPDREGETLGVRYNPNHKWKYLRGMEPDELVLIKCFDSKTDDDTAILTPHTAFADPSTPKDAPFRESIELRLLVFYD